MVRTSWGKENERDAGVPSMSQMAVKPEMDMLLLHVTLSLPRRLIILSSHLDSSLVGGDSDGTSSQYESMSLPSVIFIMWDFNVL